MNPLDWLWYCQSGATKLEMPEIVAVLALPRTFRASPGAVLELPSELTRALVIFLRAQRAEPSTTEVTLSQADDQSWVQWSESWKALGPPGLSIIMAWAGSTAPAQRTHLPVDASICTCTAL